MIRQVEARGELYLVNLFDKLQFNTDKDDETWNNLPKTTKRRLISRNLDKLKKETDIQYRIIIVKKYLKKKVGSYIVFGQQTGWMIMSVNSID